MGSAYDPIVLKDRYVDAGHYDIGQGPHAGTLINQSWIQLSIRPAFETTLKKNRPAGLFLYRLDQVYADSERWSRTFAFL